jgi:predicted nucleic-acid-binding protein
MTKIVDTNILVRFLTNDIPTEAATAKSILQSNRIQVPIIVFAETVYILENHYQINKNIVSSTLLSFIKLKNVHCPEFVNHALEIYQNENISFYDCLVIAEALNTKSANLETLDQKMEKVYLRVKSITS